MYTGTYGVALRLTLKNSNKVVPLDGTTAKLIIKSPFSRVEKNATIPSPASGVVEYITQPGDFDREGVYLIQAVVESSGKRLLSDVEEIEVKKAL